MDTTTLTAYDPELYGNQGEPFTDYEVEYLCKYYEIDGSEIMSLALGRTVPAVKSKIKKLRKQGSFDYYKNLNKYW